MPSYRTHITVLQEVASQHPSLPAFRVPQYDPQTHRILEWHTVTYSRFAADVELFAKYWTKKLSADGVLPRSVVGVWCVHG